MKKSSKGSSKGLFRSIATRGVIAAIPVAMVAAYAGNGIPTPPRLAEHAFQQVAEITVSPDTVGIAASPLYGQTKAQIDAQLDQMQALGVENIRVFVPWGSIDYFGPSASGSASWATLDLVMQAAKERNMGVMAEVNSTPPYAALSSSGLFPGAATPDPEKFAAFMTKFVSAYGDEVSAYEIWNEPNGIMFSNPIDPAAYASLLKAAYQAIKPLDPTATVVAGAVGHVYTTAFTMDPVQFVQGMIAADPTIGNYFDALSYHPYDETLPFSAGNVNPNSSFFASDTAYNQVKDMMALFPTKKVWISEFGVPTYGSVTQQQQEDLIKNLLQNWGSLSQAGPIFLYTGHDTDTGSSGPNANYGLYTDTGDPKQVITDFLAQWYAAHPQNTSGPTDPTDPPGPTAPTVPTNPTSSANPAAALAAFFGLIAQQLTNVIVQAQAFVANFVKAIANFVGSLAGPAVTTSTTAPLTTRVASVQASASTVANSTDVADASANSADAKGVDTTDTTEVGAKTHLVTQPAVAEPAAPERPETPTPGVSDSEAAETTTSTSTDSASSPSAVADVDSASADKGADDSAKSGGSDKSGDSEKSGADGQKKSERHSIGKDKEKEKADKAVPAVGPNRKASSKKATAAAGATSGSATGSKSSGSDGDGSEG